MSMPCIISAETRMSKECTTFDVGKGGMCVFSDKRLDVGHDIEIQCKAIWDQAKIGTVKWCHKIKHKLYRIGIAFS